MFDTDEYELKMQGALEHFVSELAKIRTGRAHPSMLDGIKVEAYGTLMPLNQAHDAAHLFFCPVPVLGRKCIQ